MYSPFFPHLDEAWKVRDNPNILFLFYENMKKDLKKLKHNGEIIKNILGMCHLI